jgi:hypothetical protein
MPILFMANEGNPNCVIVELVNPGEDEPCAYALRTVSKIKQGKEVTTASYCQLLSVTSSYCK